MRFIHIALVLALVVSILMVLVPTPKPVEGAGINVTFYSLNYDGWQDHGNTSYTTARTAVNALRSIDTPIDTSIGLNYVVATGLYQVKRTYLYFDTKSIPDNANILWASLYLYGRSDYSVNDFNITIQNGQPFYPQSPMGLTDYNLLHFAGDGGSINTTAYVTGAYNNISLSATGLGWIQKETNTKFVLRSSRDIAGTDVPATHNFIWFYTSEAPADKRPYLRVVYNASGLPTVRTLSPIYVTADGARIRGFLEDDGGSLTWCYFFWKQAGVGWGNYTSAGNLSTGATFYHDITGLKYNTSYEYFAGGTNPIGFESGGWRGFTTGIGIGTPTNARVIPLACSTNLSWTKGSNASKTVIRYSTGICPNSSIMGDVAYNGTGSYFEHTNLLSGTTYYYNFWGWGGGNYSLTGSGCIEVTTLAGLCDHIMTEPDTPSRWFGATDLSYVDNLPFYDIVNNIAGTIQMPYATFWMLLALAIIIVGALFIYSRSHNMVIMAVFSIVMIAIFGAIHLLPVWIAFVLAVIAGGLAWREVR